MSVTWSGGSGLLAGIDPCGVTGFNAWQMRQILTEALARLRSEPGAGPRWDSLIALVGLCDAGLSPPHRMLWFYGSSE